MSYYVSAISSLVLQTVSPVLVLVGLLLCQGVARADVIDVDAIKKWQEKLGEASTPDDSIAALQHLFDLTGRTDEGVFSFPLISLAERVKDHGLCLDIIRKVVNKNTSDTLLVDSLYHIVHRLPRSDNQQETLIFIEMRQLLTNLYEMCYDERNDCLNTLVMGYDDDPSANLYDRIRPLYRLTAVAGSAVGGDIYAEYMDRLNMLISALPDSLGPLSSLFYTQASIAYTLNEEYAKSVQANKRLLSIIEGLKERNDARGYGNANYNVNEFVALRRMLASFPALTPEEIEQYHSRIIRLTEEDPEIYEEYHDVGRVEAYYLVATGRYGEAIPVLMKAIANKANAQYRPHMLEMLVDCCELTGNRDIILDAYREYTSSLEKQLGKRRIDNINSMRLLLDMNADFRDMLCDSEEQRCQSEALYRVATYVAVAVALAAVIALVVVVRRRRRQ